MYASASRRVFRRLRDPSAPIRKLQGVSFDLEETSEEPELHGFRFPHIWLTRVA
jgi:hypothetical protein